VDCYPTTLEGAVRHNAWWDAMALRALEQNKPEARISEQASEHPNLKTSTFRQLIEK
jgi:hypothetical protein